MGLFSFAVLSDTERRLPFYLVGVGFDFNQDMDPHSREEGYPYYQWIQCVEGEGLLRLGEREITVCANQAMFLLPGEPHQYYSRGGPWRVHWFTFGGRGVPDVLSSIGMNQSGVYGVGNGDLLQEKIRFGMRQLLARDPLHAMECSALVYDFLIALMRYAHPTNHESVERKYRRLRPVFDFISENYHNVITVDRLARTLGVTPQHFCHLFKDAMRQRPFEYLNSFRIARSKDLMLEEPELPLSDISRQCGYESLNYFCSVFRKLEGMSPGHYRKLHSPLFSQSGSVAP